MDSQFELRWWKRKDKELKLLLWNKINVSDCTTLCCNFSTWRVKLHRNKQKRNKNYFKISGDSKYCSRVWVTEGSKCVKKIQVTIIDSGLSYREVWVSKGSSYWESTVINIFCINIFNFTLKVIQKFDKIYLPEKEHLNNFFHF